MIIKRILNNNVVITSDENGEETIVMGKGIGYQKAKGDTIDEEKINKVFRISNREVSDKSITSGSNCRIYMADISYLWVALEIYTCIYK